MALVSALNIITPALRRIGAIGAIETPSAKATQTALDALNGLIDTWSVIPPTQVRDIESVVTLGAGLSFLTIGPGQQINVPVPDRIESAYARLFNLDEDIEVADKPKYDSVEQKGLGSTWPELLWFDQGQPTGRVYFWPVPAANTEIHITTRGVLATFASATDTQNLPPGALRALRLALAVDVAADFQVPVSQDLRVAAATAFDAFAASNLIVPQLNMEVGSPAIQTRLGQFLSGGTS